MALEGLQAVLDKEEVLATFKVSDLLASPEVVEGKYKAHVRGYLPLSRAAGSSDQQQSVTDYERNLIAKVSSGIASVGYISAEYGYGKTSTAAYLWNRCREANILAVPPFAIEQLSDLITAAYAWGRFELGRTRPPLLPELEQLYRSYMERSISDDARGDREKAALLTDLERQGRYTAKLLTADFIHFFEQYADLMISAGYKAVVLLPDELQQYTNPTINSGVSEPLSPLFELVNGLSTRHGYLKSAVIFITPTKDLALIRDNRGDLVDRMQQSGLGFDLNNIYDADFARRLWQRLAGEFSFQSEAQAMVTEEALRSLGEIANRHDLGSGPRTVVNGFKAIINRYTQQPAGGSFVRYSPIHLVEDFLKGTITFSGAVNKLAEEVGKALRQPVVKGQPQYERAVKLIAAFPNGGAADALIAEAGLTEAVETLVEQQLTIRLGGRDSDGKLIYEGMTLRGLAPDQDKANWLSDTANQFIRLTFQPNSDKAMERAANACKRLLRKRFFKDADWKVIDEGLASGNRDAFLLLEGGFAQTSRRYPQRRIYIRIIRDDHAHHALIPLLADLTLTIDLSRYRELSENQQLDEPGSFETSKPRNLRLRLNLSHHDPQQIYAPLRNELRTAISSRRVTPLLLLNLHAYMDELLVAHQVPKADRPYVENNFQNDLLDGIVNDMFDPELTSGIAGGTRVIEDAYLKAITAIYPDYHTLIGNSQFNKAIKEYRTALAKLPSPYQRQGEESFEATKEETADLFNRTNVGLDNFISDFPRLIQKERDWKAKQLGVVRFSLHPWEQRIIKLLSDSGQTDPASRPPRLRLTEVQEDARLLGYREDEIVLLLDLLNERGLAERQGDYLVQRENKVIAPHELRHRLDLHQKRLTRLRRAFPDDGLLTNQSQQVQMIDKDLTGHNQPDERKLNQYEMTLKTYDKQLATWLVDQQKQMGKAIRLLKPPTLNDRELKGLAQTYNDQLELPLEPLRQQAAAQVAVFADKLRHLFVDYQQLEARLSAANTDGEDLGDDGLLTMQAALERLRQAAETSRSEVEQARSLAQRWQKASAVLTDAVQLKAEIEAEREPGAAPRLLDEWLRSVRERLSVARFDALIEAEGTWGNGLAQVRGELVLARQQGERHFKQIQNSYREVLKRAGLPEAQQPSISFNRQDPPASVQSLLSAVLVGWQTLVVPPSLQSQQLISGIQQMQTATDPDMERASREQMLAACATISRQLTITHQQLVSLLTEAAPTIGLGPGEFSKMLPILQAARQQLADLTAEATTLRASFSHLNLTDSERRLLALLQVQVGSDGTVDLAALLQEGNTQQVWADLTNLYNKLCLRVRLEVIAHE